jgi:replication factor A1
MGCVANRMTGLLLLKKVTVTGNIMSDEFGPQMRVHSTEISATDVQAEADALWNEMEGCM